MIPSLYFLISKITLVQPRVLKLSKEEWSALMEYLLATRVHEGVISVQ